jgi:uncharacterized membrane protein YfcA
MSFLIGFFAGVFGGLIGGGGGIVMIPLLVSVLRVDQLKAHGVSLVALVFTGIAGAITYAMQGTVDVTAALLLAAPGAVTARAGARFAHSLPEWKLKRSFGGYLLFVSSLLLLKPYLTTLHAPASGMIKVILLLLTGAFMGFLSGMMGVGGGAIMIPAMVLLTGFAQHVAQGTSLLAMVPSGSVGAYTHWKLGNVQIDILRGLVPGIFLGTFVGGMLAHTLSDAALRIAFALVLLWTGVRYLRSRHPSGDRTTPHQSAV